MPLQYRPDNGALLYEADTDALQFECCCEEVGINSSSSSSESSSQTASSSSSSEGCSYSITVILNWASGGDYPDLDLYTKVDGNVCYYLDQSTGGLSLNDDAHPGCASTPTPPEQITGSFTEDKTFYVWYSQFSDCASEKTPNLTTISVHNTGFVSIYVNENEVMPGNSHNISSYAYAGYDTGPVPGYTGGTEVEVCCGEC